MELLFFALAIVLAWTGFICVTRYKNHKALSTSKPNALKAEKFSSASATIIKAYNDLPEEHRPAYDIKAGLRALDTKHGLETVTAHFVHRSRYSHYDDLAFSWSCSCIWNEFDYEYTQHEECLHFPEYKALYDSIDDIGDSLRAREQAILAREHQMVLAGIESDLRSIDEITQALRNERDLIDNVTKEICS